MGKHLKSKIVDFRRGQETTRLEQSDEFVMTMVEDARVDRAALQRRGGQVLLKATTTAAVCTDFVSGSSQFATLPAATSTVWPLGTKFTVEALVSADSLAADRYILGGAANCGLRIYITSAGVVTAILRDSGGTETTLTAGTFSTGTTIAIQVKRDGAAVSLRANGSTDTDTMSATNVLAAQTTPFIAKYDTGNYFDGKIEFVRAFRVAKSHVLDLWSRLLDPRAPSVLFDYICEVDAAGNFTDRGPLGLHAQTSGTVASVATSLAINHAPILGFASNVDANGTPRLYFQAGGVTYPVAL